MATSIKQIKEESHSLLRKYQGWQVQLLRHELDRTGKMIIQAGGTIPDVRNEHGEEVVEKRLMLNEILHWVPQAATVEPVIGAESETIAGGIA